ncbi:MAG: alpha/beta fold hydrolase [Pseudonocardiaceae bacterium]
MGSTEHERAEHHLDWRSTAVQDRPASYGVAGAGAPVVFLHGWGLAHRSYKRALKRLVAKHLRVYAPALPGGGGTASLPAAELSLAGYASWVAEFIQVVGIDEPVTLIGHSFGGGVAIRTAHDAPGRVSRLILVNSIGGSAWTDGKGVIRAIAERPWWDWGLHLREDVLPLRQITRVLPVITEDLLPNLLHDPAAIWRAAQIARTADLTNELEELKRRRLPVVIVWSKDDNVIPRASLATLRSALGDPAVITVPGSHGWVLSDPERFAEVITNLILIPAGLDPPAPLRPHHGTPASDVLTGEHKGPEGAGATAEPA